MQEFISIPSQNRQCKIVKAQTLPRSLHCVTWLVIVTQLWLPYSNVTITAAPRVTEAEAGETHTSSGPEASPNRTVPNVQPPAQTPSFSDPPADEEFFKARAFAEPLVPMRKATTVAENIALAQAIQIFIARTNHEDVSAINSFLESYPDSAWRASLVLNLGLFYRKTGYFSKALSSWAEAWTMAKSETNPKASILADLAIGELLDLNARLGRFDKIELLLVEIAGRNIRGAATEKVTGAREGLWQMRNRPEEAFLCGPYAIERICASMKRSDAYRDTIATCKSTTNGTSLRTIWRLANELGMNYQMAKRNPGSQVIFPAVIHWKEGHYAALVRQRNGQFLVQDPTFGDDLWVTQNAIDAEGSGYFLVPSETLPSGWAAVTEEEGATVWGKGTTSSSDPNPDGCDDTVTDTCYSCPTGGGGGAPPGGCGGGGFGAAAGAAAGAGGGFGGGSGGPLYHGGKAMARHTFHAMLVSLHIYDTPVGYRAPRGHGVEFTVTYNQREANQPQNFAYSNLGPKWSFDWLAYIKDDPANTNADKEYYMPGGGTKVYQYDSGNNNFRSLTADRSALVMTATNAYERQMPDGSKQIFGLSDGATSNPRKIFMTKLLDPSSNAVTLTYNSNFCLVSIQDAVGQVTTISYENTNDIRKITKVTDPFGRYAAFDYNTNLQLIKITDVIGVTSEFTYGSGDFITSLITPYGTTTFSYGETNRNRWLEATDPLGQKERLEYDDGANSQLTSAETPAPSGYLNSHLYYQNSFYWDKKSYQYTNDVTKARIYNWCKTQTGNQTSRTLRTVKNPLERRAWRKYLNQIDTRTEGDSGLPIETARVLDDGSTQRYQYEYNAMGKPTKITDPTNRVTLFTYDTNAIDLLEIRQQVGSTNELLASFVYNSSHRRLTAVDAAGQTNRFGYNAYGQLTAVTNPLNETMTLYYNSNGYVTNITGAVSGAASSFTYGGTNRVRNITDSEGYTLTFDYDALDRPVKITYPDGTFEQIVYKWLDAVLRKDRRGHWTQTVYDPLRRVTDVQDALNRVIHLEWCSCGSLESITDPLGRVTRWERDLQGRVTAKVYPDDTRVTYTYESAVSRLKSMTDARNQTTGYEYFIDDNLRKISYSNAVVSTPSVTLTYHTNYNRLVAMVDGIGTNTYSYYAVSNTVLGAGHLDSIDGPLTNDTITYTYDELGRVRSRAINGVAARVTYDSLGRITITTNLLGSFTNVYVNNTLRLASNNYPNGQTTTFGYFGNTNDQRLQTIWHKKSDANTISKFDYVYDADGRIINWTQQADSDTPKLWMMEYDGVDQLLGVTIRSNGIAGAVLNRYAYGYDKAGNRTSEQKDLGVSTTTANNLNQLTDIGASSGPARFRGSLNEIGTVTVSGSPAAFDTRTSNFVAFASITSGSNVVPVVAADYSGNRVTNKYGIVVTNNGVAKTLTYDLNGNLTSVVTATFTNSYEWDAANRFAAIETREVGQVTKRSEFTYDGLSRWVRIVEKTNGVSQAENWLLWCGDELCEKRDETGAAASRRYFAQGEHLSGVPYLYARDHLGSIRELLDSSQAVQARYDYAPYGRRNSTTANTEPDFAYTGHFYHGASGLHLAMYRALDSSMGTWTSRDPIAEFGGLNYYSYLNNRPASGRDPLGLSGRDVYRIINTTQDVITHMNATGQRIEPGFLNNLSQLWNRERRGCGEQAGQVVDALIWRNYDDSWRFSTVTTLEPPLLHQFVVAKSSNPADPLLLLDPMKNSIQAIYSGTYPWIILNADTVSTEGEVSSSCFY
jgi:RHS repeat-associated protein